MFMLRRTVEDRAEFVLLTVLPPGLQVVNIWSRSRRNHAVLDGSCDISNRS